VGPAALHAWARHSSSAERARGREHSQGAAAPRAARSLPFPHSWPDMGESDNKIYVGGLSHDTTNDGLRNHFLQYGDIADSVVMMDKVLNRSRGFGFVTFKDAAAANAALGTSHVLDGREVSTKKAVRETQPALVQESGGIYNAVKIFVGGLPSSCDYDKLTGYFGRYGRIQDAVVMMDQQTQRHRGFGYVTYADSTSVEEVMKEYKDHRIDGKWVEVKRCIPQDAMRDGRGGGGGGRQSSDRGRDRDRDRDQGGSYGGSPSSGQAPPPGSPGGYPDPYSDPYAAYYARGGAYPGYNPYGMGYPPHPYGAYGMPGYPPSAYGAYPGYANGAYGPYGASAYGASPYGANGAYAAYGQPGQPPRPDYGAAPPQGALPPATGGSPTPAALPSSSPPPDAGSSRHGSSRASPY